jgi:hypothetical protein
MHDPWPVGLPSSSRAWLHASEHGRPYMCRKWAAISFQTEMMMVSQLLSITSRVAKCLLSSVSSVEALHCPKAYMISSLLACLSLGWKKQKKIFYSTAKVQVWVCSVTSKFQKFYKISCHIESLDACMEH